MATLPQMFDATQVEPQGISQQLPVSGSEGYPVVITASEFKASKNNANNGYLELTLEVIDGEHKGSSGAYRINLFHDNPKTVEIAKRQLSAICHAVNVFQVADSAQLHNIPFRAVVGYQKLSPEQMEAKNKGEEVIPFTEVKGVLGFDGSQPGKPKNGQTAAPAPAPAAAPQQQVQLPQTAAPWGGQPAAQPEAPAAPGWQQAPNAATPPWGAK